MVKNPKVTKTARNWKILSATALVLQMLPIWSCSIFYSILFLKYGVNMLDLCVIYTINKESYLFLSRSCKFLFCVGKSMYSIWDLCIDAKFVLQSSERRVVIWAAFFFISYAVLFLTYHTHRQLRMWNGNRLTENRFFTGNRFSKLLTVFEFLIFEERV